MTQNNNYQLEADPQEERRMCLICGDHSLRAPYYGRAHQGEYVIKLRDLCVLDTAPTVFFYIPSRYPIAAPYFPAMTNLTHFGANYNTYGFRVMAKLVLLCISQLHPTFARPMMNLA